MTGAFTAAPIQSRPILRPILAPRERCGATADGSPPAVPRALGGLGLISPALPGKAAELQGEFAQSDNRVMRRFGQAGAMSSCASYC